MADYIYGVQKVHNVTTADEALTLTMDFWTVSTTVNILTAATTGGTAASQMALNKLVEIISENGQPVLLSAPTPPAAAGGDYTLKFAIEHHCSWGTDGTALVAAIKKDGVNYGFAADTTLAATVSTSI